MPARAGLAQMEHVEPMDAGEIQKLLWRAACLVFESHSRKVEEGRSPSGVVHCWAVSMQRCALCVRGARTWASEHFIASISAAIRCSVTRNVPWSRKKDG
jgi:hypothetical protein